MKKEMEMIKEADQKYIEKRTCKTLNLPDWMIKELGNRTKRCEIIREAIKEFIEKDKLNKYKGNGNFQLISVKIDREYADYLDKITDLKSTDRRYLSSCDAIRTAIEDYLEKEHIEEKVEENTEPKLDYLQRNGIKILKILH